MYMNPEDEDKIYDISGEISRLIAYDLQGNLRPREEKELLNRFSAIIAEIIKLHRDYKEGLPAFHGRPVTSQEISLKQKELWMLSPQIKDAQAKSKILELMISLHPAAKEIEFEVR